MLDWTTVVLSILCCSGVCAEVNAVCFWALDGWFESFCPSTRLIWREELTLLYHHYVRLSPLVVKTLIGSALLDKLILFVRRKWIWTHWSKLTVPVVSSCIVDLVGLPHYLLLILLLIRVHTACHPLHVCLVSTNSLDNLPFVSSFDILC